MAEVASAYVSLMPSAKGFGSKLSSQVGGEVDSAGKQLGSRLGSALKVGILAGGAAAGAVFASTVGAASDAQQAVGGVESVFGKYASTVLKDSKRAAQGLGLSSSAYNELITVSGAMLKNKGLTDFADRSRDLITVGADLSAMFGGTTKDAVGALNAAMRGESDPIERYGISLNETAVNAELAAKGQDDLKGAALEQAKTQARLSLIMRQSADAQGAFGRESNTLAGQQQRLGAQFENIKIAVGTGLLPVLTRVAGFVNTTMLPAITAFVKGFRDGTGAGGQLATVMSTARTTIVGFASAVAPIAGFMLRNKAAVATFVGVIGTVILVTKAWRAAQFAMNLVLAANPIGLVVVAIAALAAGAVIAYKRSATFRGIVDKLWSALKTAGKWLASVGAAAASLAGRVASTALPKISALASLLGGALVGAVRVAIGIISSIIGKVVEFGGALVKAVGKAGEFLSGVKAKIEAAFNFIKSIPGKVTGVFSNAGTLLLNAGRQLMEGLAAGIGEKINAAIDKVKDGLAKIKGLLPGSPIKWGPLKNWNNGGAGKRLMDLVAKGITAATPKTVKAAQSAFEKISESLKKTRDGLRSTLDGLKSDFASIVESVSGAFTGNLFDVSATLDDDGNVVKTVGQNFVEGLMGKKAELTGLLASFNTLRGWGLDPAFLTQLFASGQGALITELAGMGQAGATSAASLFGEVTNLGNQLGNAVASNDPVADRIDETNRLLGIAVTQLEFLGDDIGKQLNGAAAKARRNKKKRGKK